MKQRQGKEFWIDHVAEWERSGLSQKRYCLEVGIVYSNFMYWSRKIRTEEMEQEQGSGCLAVPIGQAFLGAHSVADFPLQAQGIELSFGDAVIRVYGTCTTRQLLQLAQLCADMQGAGSYVPA